MDQTDRFLLRNHAKVKFGREIRHSIWTDNRWKAKLRQMNYWTLYSSKEMESWVTNYFCGTTLAQKRLDRNLHQFQVWAERKRGFPPSIFFKFILYGNGLSRTGFKSKINNRTSEKITFKKVGNLICLDSCLTATSSRCYPEIWLWVYNLMQL